MGIMHNTKTEREIENNNTLFYFIILSNSEDENVDNRIDLAILIIDYIKIVSK